jgi:hypothetical protein
MPNHLQFYLVCRKEGSEAVDGADERWWSPLRVCSLEARTCMPSAALVCRQRK